MTLQLQMLGTGSAFAKAYWNNNGILSKGEVSYLIDCGITAPMAIHHLGRSFNDFEGVIVTHMHADHVGGLEEYAFQMRFKYGRKPKLIIAAPLIQLLWEQTLKGGLTQDGIDKLEDVFEVCAVEPETSYLLMEGVQIRFIETPHIEGRRSYSLLFDEAFFYSADMRFKPDLLIALVEQGVQRIWHDCQFIEPGEVHATLSQLLSLPLAVQERISLMHYGDERSMYEGLTGPMPFINQHEIYTVLK